MGLGVFLEGSEFGGWFGWDAGGKSTGGVFVSETFGLGRRMI